MARGQVREQNIIENCWICGNSANSREHRIKKSDITPLFQNGKPLYINSPVHKNSTVQGPNSDFFKFGQSLCKKCNGSLTQPYDLAWQALSSRLKQLINTDPKQPISCVSNCFTKRHQLRRLRQCHLYFVKWFGCQLMDTRCNFDKEGFAKSIQKGNAYPDLYLKFGTSLWGSGGAGQSDLNARFENQKLFHATQIYDAGEGLAVLVIYAKSITPLINALEGAWHPKTGTRIKFFDDNLI